MLSTIVKMKDNYALDIWGNYLSVKVSKNISGEWVLSSILILKDDSEIQIAKKILND